MVIKEISSYRGNYYEIYLENIKIKTIKITRVRRERNGFVYFILFDNDGKVLDEVYRFINFNCVNETVNGREQMINALKILYSYKIIINKEFEDFDKKDLKGLSNLILGIGIDKDECTKEPILSRGSSTHDIYFDNIRKFYKYLKIENEFLFEQRIAYSLKNGYGFFGHTNSVKVDKYTTNKGNSKSNIGLVPKYISFNEYKKIIKYINKQTNNVLRNIIIINLMYTTGMRLGEVLGLTLEDVKENVDNSLYGTIYVRNRTTDKSYQNAKTCMNVNSTKDYNTVLYKTQNEGYQLINIAPELFKLIKEYIDESRSVLDVSEIVMNNIIDYATADSVDNKKENQYLFLNKNGLPLSSSGWNKFLKAVFKDVGIVIDKGHKKNNLSHRFRHGYAMYLINEDKRKIEYVKEKMRHRSLQSTLIYYNPTEEEKLSDIKRIEDKARQKLREE